MYLYTRTSFFCARLWKTLLPLLFCGIFTGLAVASKWQGAYGIIGLAVIFFWTLGQRYYEYKTTDQKKFWKYAIITCAASLAFFIIIPLTIYILSYIPYWNTSSLYPNLHFLTSGEELNLWQRAIYWLYPRSPFLSGVVQNQMNMFNYHSQYVLGATHPFTSPWWEWIVSWRPIFLFSNDLGGGTVQGISSFGNPLVWWGGIAALVYCLYAAITRRDKVAIFLVIAYLSQIFPWVFVSRISFIYHYFPNVPFLVLMITYTFKEIYSKSGKKAAFSYAVAVFALFVLFYPVLTGIPIDRNFVDIYLRWLPHWILVI